MLRLDFEIAQEQAASLGRAGRKLQESIERFQRDQQASFDRDTQISEIAERAWALIVQREVVGFRHQNLKWVRDQFDIPPAALSRLGARNP